VIETAKPTAEVCGDRGVCVIAKKIAKQESKNGTHFEKLFMCAFISFFKDTVDVMILSKG